MSAARRALRALTTRGRAVLAAGAACAVAAVLVGQDDLLRVGVLLLVLPLLSAWAVSRTRYRLSCAREVSPPRIAVEQEGRVLLRLDNLSRLPTGLLLVEDTVPGALGARPRFVLDRVEPQGRRAVAYAVRAAARGRYAVGPLRLRLADPFGLCELRRSFTARDGVTVTPVVTPLPRTGLGGEWSGSGTSRARSLAAAGDDDVTTREYRHGDPLHRVHWRSTARYGELVVRREEQPWQARASVLLDARARAHRGSGSLPSTSSLEAAVSAAASVGVHLARAGYQLRVATQDGPLVGGGHGLPGSSDVAAVEAEGLLLDALAVLSPGGGPGLGALLPALGGASDALLVAVLGALEPHEAGELARRHAGRGAAVAVLLDVETWSERAPARPPARPVAAPDDPVGRTAALLAAEGWRVLRLGRGDDLAALWPLAAGPSGAATAGERVTA
ncbi:DUF58 domain-containing protein [Vallicoccus soli]|uniref:DUF58 domain-containing protein n=1 Tax=Vallicoccus soli TaxID=2339232 RepID=A0A3A3Z7L0_9ACTN|nr:DUF58 domain-containing protein [Vallicoccus soli]RJK96827.1 DUF58 domain-containing protein [Vallicoccus soli]